MARETACEPGRKKYQQEREPGAGETPEHVEALLDEKRHDKYVQEDHDASERGGGFERPQVAEVAEIDEGYDGEDDRGSHGMDHEGGLKRRCRHANPHGRAAKRPAHEAMGDGDERGFFGDVHHS